MPKPSKSLFLKLGPETLPFKREKNNRKVLPGEDYPLSEYVYNATENEYPQDCKRISNFEDIEKKKNTSSYRKIISVSKIQKKSP